MVGKRESQSLLFLFAQAVATKTQVVQNALQCVGKTNNVSFDTSLPQPTPEGGATSTLSKDFIAHAGEGMCTRRG